MRRFGTGYAGFYYPTELPGLNSESIIYCVGAGEDISHDVEIANKLGAHCHVFDPTPRAIQHVEMVKQVFEGVEKPENNKRYGGGDPNYWSGLLEYRIEPENLHIHPWGIHTTTNPAVKFYLPTNIEYVSCSVVEGMKGANFIEVNVKTLKETMKLLGHSRIDLLKLDIEGCECDVIDQMLDENILPKYLSVDFDLGWTGESIRNLPRCKETIARLLQKGYSVLRENGPEWSFHLTDQTS